MKKLILLICILLISCQDDCEFASEKIGDSYIFRGDTLLIIEWHTWTTYRVLNINKGDTETYSIYLFNKLDKIK